MAEIICSDCGQYKSECKCGKKNIADWQKWLATQQDAKIGGSNASDRVE